MQSDKKQHVNVILQKQQKSSELAAFLHGCCGFPVTSTFTTSIENEHFLSWPGLTSKLIKKHLLPSCPTTLGHMHQESQHLQSRKPIATNDYITNIRKNIAKLKSGKNVNSDLKSLLTKHISEDAFPPSPTPNVKTNQVIYSIFESNPKNIGYLDLTGRFPLYLQEAISISSLPITLMQMLFTGNH